MRRRRARHRPTRCRTKVPRRPNRSGCYLQAMLTLTCIQVEYGIQRVRNRTRLIGFQKAKDRASSLSVERAPTREPVMNNTLGKIIAAGALAGALALAGTPPYAANGRNAAFAAGVGAGQVGGAVLGGGYGAYPAYGGYYGGPRLCLWGLRVSPALLPAPLLPSLLSIGDPPRLRCEAAPACIVAGAIRNPILPGLRPPDILPCK